MINPDDILIESYSTQPSSLRIAIVTETFPPEVNGVAMTLGRIVEGLLKRGHSVQLIRPRQASESSIPMRDGLDEVLCVGIQLPAYKELRFGLPIKSRLTKIWNGKRPDIVHVATEGPLGWSAVAAARKLKLPITSSFHTNFHSYSQHYGLGLLKSPIENYLRKLHNRTEATMVPTRTLMHELQVRGFKNVTLLSRGVATDLFSPAKRSQTLRETWGANPEDVVALFVSRLAMEKNVGLAISAFRAIKLKLPTAKLVFVGDGPMRKQLEISCPDVIFSGVRKNEDLAAHYASSDLFLFPSLTETFGNVVPEALASGLAVLSYDKAAAKELIHSEKNGILVTPGEELSFINAAVELATNVPKQQEIRLAAAGSIAHLGWDAIHNSFVDTLSNVLERHEKHHSMASKPLARSHNVTHSNA
jgi:glycosyltransferase involved in cell wall biosynthesis